MPAAAAVVLPGVPVIGERVKGVTVEGVPLRLCILLRVGVLMGVEVLVEGGSVVVRAGMVRV